ncbi:hypothetical protein CANARDRAFT_204638 [[Candida] arabinofermentans NRRL YB-2248]|uniref:Amino acid permease/ SLC12A domain-containing protein n=1 Tax=[Candida] arabinofermentans NRRL YB-2248 TaxID=983967 RepID=A0A1E4STA4_9ASCO|nr:hypothetical protein CANARDRAFT_204638 [[Candida] arabinofermentans NRRL YB-2248]
MVKSFSKFSLFSLSFDIGAAWVGLITSVSTSLICAGPAGSIWCFPVACFIVEVMALGMAELSSAYPSSGGQYHWAFCVSSPEQAPLAAFVVGWISIFAWLIGAASIANYIASFLMGIGVLWNDSFSIEQWQVYLVYVLVTWIVVFICVFFQKWLPKLFSLNFYANVLFFLICFITIGASHKAGFHDASFVFGTDTNYTGWSSAGVAFMLGVGNSFYSLIGIDAAPHMSDEIPEPEKNVPLAVILPAILAFLTAWPFAIMFTYTMGDMDSVLNTDTGLAVLQIFYNATGSKSATTGLSVLCIYCLFGALIGAIEGTSRIIWSFACDNGFIYSNFYKQIHPNFKVPVWALGFCGIFLTLYGVIFIGSTTVFFAIISCVGILMFQSYVIPQGILLVRGRHLLPENRHFNLGKFGAPINFLSCVFIAVFTVFFCMPSARPVTAQNMNWAVVVCSGLLLYVAGHWIFFKRKEFTGPTIDRSILQSSRSHSF